MANKTLGYILLAAGIGIVALSYNGIRKIVGLPLPSMLNDNYILIIGAVILIIGAYLGFGGLSGSKKQAAEVPIYEGEGKKRRIVGYQKMSK